MKRHFSLISALFITAIMAGCSLNESNQNKTGLTLTSLAAVSAKDNGLSQIERKAAKNVAMLDEIKDARVRIQNNNAYVDVIMKNQPARNTAHEKGHADTPDNRKRTGSVTGYVPDKDETRDGRHTQMGGTGIYSNTGQAGTGIYRGAADQERIDTTDRDQAGSMNGSRSTAHNGSLNAGNETGNDGVTHTESNGTPGYSSVSTPLEQRIADQVRKADSTINKVYISVNNSHVKNLSLNDGRNQDNSRPRTNMFMTQSMAAADDTDADHDDNDTDLGWIGLLGLLGLLGRKRKNDRVD